MDWGISGNRAERAVDAAAAAVFAAAVGFALWAPAPVGAPAVAAGSAFAFLMAYFSLRRLSADEPAFSLPGFEPPTFEPIAEPEAGAELLLNDVLSGVAPDARVVRLFGPEQAFAGNPPAAPDASEALSEALAELRRSLR